MFNPLDLFRRRHEPEEGEAPEEIALERMDDGTIREIGGDDDADVEKGK